MHEMHNDIVRRIVILEHFRLRRRLVAAEAVCDYCAATNYAVLILPSRSHERDDESVRGPENRAIGLARGKARADSHACRVHT